MRQINKKNITQKQNGREHFYACNKQKNKVNGKEEYAPYEVKKKKRKNIRRRGQNHWIIKVNMIEKQSIKLWNSDGENRRRNER